MDRCALPLGWASSTLCVSVDNNILRELRDTRLIIVWIAFGVNFHFIVRLVRQLQVRHFIIHIQHILLLLGYHVKLAGLEDSFEHGLIFVGVRGSGSGSVLGLRHLCGASHLLLDLHFNVLGLELLAIVLVGLHLGVEPLTTCIRVRSVSRSIFSFVLAPGAPIRKPILFQHGICDSQPPDIDILGCSCLRLLNLDPRSRTSACASLDNFFTSTA